MIDLIQAYIDELREKVIVYKFSSLEEEIVFLKKSNRKYYQNNSISIRYIVLNRISDR